MKKGMRITAPAVFGLNFVALFLFLAWHDVRAGEPETLREVREQREALLKRIVKTVEKASEAGHGRAEDLWKARINLIRFRRNAEDDPSRKARFQSRIVEIQKSRFEFARKSYEDGMEDGSGLEVLRAEERYLLARQRLLEMKARARPDGSGEDRPSDS